MNIENYHNFDQIDLTNLLNAIQAHWAHWSVNLRAKSKGVSEELTFHIHARQKYVTISIQIGEGFDIQQWGLVLINDDNKFKSGDVFGIGSQGAMRSKARGNASDGDLSWVRWEGAKYARTSFEKGAA